ncbi:MAG: hypothetical protein KAV87_42395, partial [Desulfobacteraceae bacterium]|nr:hypothetical protein [Desulfobacteraceae bacterium]
VLGYPFSPAHSITHTCGNRDAGKKVTKSYSINCNPFSRAMTSPLSTENATLGGLIYEYISTLYPPDDDMMESPRCVYPCFSWHASSLSPSSANVKHKIIDVPKISQNIQ